jgi:hypothetical protein
LHNSKLLQNSFLPQHAYINLINGFIKRYDLSLREVERLLMNFEIYQVMSNKTQSNRFIFGDAMQIALGICIFSTDLELAISLLKNTLNPEKLGYALGTNYTTEITDRPDFEQLIYNVIKIQMRSKADRVYEKLNTSDQMIIQNFNRLYNGSFVPDDSERIDLLINTIKIMGLSE